MNLKFKFYIAVNIVLCLIAIIGVLIGVLINNPISTPLLEAVGTGLLAAALVNIFDRAFTLETPLAQKPRIEVIAEKRSEIPQEFFDRKLTAGKVDIMGVSLNYLLKELVEDPKQIIINRLLSHHLQLRLFLVHPDSPYLVQRAAEDREDLARMIGRQKQGVRLCVKFYEQLDAKYSAMAASGNLDLQALGRLQIKLLNFCPYMSIYRLDDDDIYWGLYTSDKAGLELPLFKTSASVDLKLYNHLHQHIHGIMDRDTAYPDLVSMVNLGAPFLNTDLLSKII